MISGFDVWVSAPKKWDGRIRKGSVTSWAPRGQFSERMGPAGRVGD